jgi:hypothetical protein
VRSNADRITSNIIINNLLLFPSPFCNSTGPILQSLSLSLSVSHSLSLSLSVYPSLSRSLSLSLSLPPLFSPHSMSAAGRIGTSDLVDRTYRFVKKVREDEEAAAPKVYVPKSIDSDLIDEEDSVYN